MTWSPLACGIISGKYDSGVPPYSRASLKVLALSRLSLSRHVLLFFLELCNILWLCALGSLCGWCSNGCVRVFQVLALGVFPCGCV